MKKPLVLLFCMSLLVSCSPQNSNESTNETAETVIETENAGEETVIEITDQPLSFDTAEDFLQYILNNRWRNITIYTREEIVNDGYYEALKPLLSDDDILYYTTDTNQYSIDADSFHIVRRIENNTDEHTVSVKDIYASYTYQYPDKVSTTVSEADLLIDYQNLTDLTVPVKHTGSAYYASIEDYMNKICESEQEEAYDSFFFRNTISTDRLREDALIQSILSEEYTAELTGKVFRIELMDDLSEGFGLVQTCVDSYHALKNTHFIEVEDYKDKYNYTILLDEVSAIHQGDPMPETARVLLIRTLGRISVRNGDAYVTTAYRSSFEPYYVEIKSISYDTDDLSSFSVMYYGFEYKEFEEADTVYETYLPYRLNP